MAIIRNADSILVTELAKLIQLESDRLADLIKRELEAQGHKDTGRLYNSIKASLTYFNDTVSSVIEAEDYYIYVNDGVSKTNFKLSRNYINRVKASFQRKGLTDKEALQAAFATAYVHKLYGIPSKAHTINRKSKLPPGRGAQFYSRVGRRRGFMNVIVGKEDILIAQRIEFRIERLINNEFDSIFKNRK